jgi:hypothetical protein
VGRCEDEMFSQNGDDAGATQQFRRKLANHYST